MKPAAIVSRFWRVVLRGPAEEIVKVARDVGAAGFAATIADALRAQIAADLTAGRGGAVNRKKLALGILVRERWNHGEGVDESRDRR